MKGRARSGKWHMDSKSGSEKWEVRVARIEKNERREGGKRKSRRGSISEGSL